MLLCCGSLAGARARLVAVGLALAAMTLPAWAQPPSTASLTLRTPEVRTFELALDELWVDARDPDGPPAERLSAHGLKLVKRHGRLLQLRLDAAATAQDLVQQGRRVAQSLPRSAFMLALYDRGRPRDDEHRALLTSDVALLMEPGQRAERFAGTTVRVEAVANVPDAYVVHAGDPLAAVGLAEQLVVQRGVRHAYPLLKRTLFPR